MAEYNYVNHELAPVYDKNSKILILGSLPSVKSREQGFYYGHPRNRFWKVLSAVLGVDEPQSIGEKKAMLLSHGIALYDVIEQCEIAGSSDASIRNVTPADIRAIAQASRLRVVFTNGRTAGKLYRKYQAQTVALPMTELPSTSPANAAFSLEKLTELWGAELEKWIGADKVMEKTEGR